MTVHAPLDVPPAAATVEELAERAGGIAMSIAMATLRDPEKAADVAQDVVVDVLRGLPRLKDRRAFDAWVRRIAVRHLSRALRRRTVRRAREAELTEEVATTGADHEAVLLRLSVARALAKLPPRQQLAVILRYLHDLSDADVATALGCRTGTAASLLSRARSTLREDAELRRLMGPDWKDWT
ncbi:RNA polymerase sigma factor [Miltoncostaea oceani]|uniref:RNA polymerase sigma factor n=1 Tax=Miltoncostaea oceani TaxID=2843216 RepID=UPI001C3D4A13|nr:sigma-70 family RNA polymerase sigma factor [Miltoncostaea oceani]